MTPNAIFIPVLIHMLLVFFLYIRLASAKRQASANGLVDSKVTALNPKAWPDNVVKISNNIANQFETPVLFYALSLILFLTDNVNNLTLSLMSIYVLSRIFHAYIHISSNYVPHRLRVFLIGVLVLLSTCLWMLFELAMQQFP